MKTILKNIITKLQILCLFFASTNICYATENPIVVGENVLPIKTVIMKFGITMGSVLISLLIIWILLNFYKAYTAEETKKAKTQSLYGDTLDTPKSIDDAVIMFIDKNRL